METDNAVIEHRHFVVIDTKDEFTRDPGVKNCGEMLQSCTNTNTVKTKE